MTLTVAVDFDGVVHDHYKGWDDGTIYGPPIVGAFDGLRSLMEEYAVFIHTCRNPIQVQEWMEDHSGIVCVTDSTFFQGHREYWNRREELLITQKKLPAIRYIDDRAVRFETWDQVMQDRATW